MKEYPILFSAPMVRAILDGKKGNNEQRKVHIPFEEIAGLYEGGMTVKEIAAKYGVSVMPIKRILHEGGMQMRLAKRRTGVGSGDKNSAWKGGRRQRKDGYIVLWTPNGEVLEHRAVMEKHLGRSLKECEIVHHIDGNKSNNDISNLCVMTQSEHIREHISSLHEARYGKK